MTFNDGGLGIKLLQSAPRGLCGIHYGQSTTRYIRTLALSSLLKPMCGALCCGANREDMLEWSWSGWVKGRDRVNGVACAGHNGRAIHGRGVNTEDQHSSQGPVGDRSQQEKLAQY